MTRRLDLKCGFLCNNNCSFCVQAHKKRYGNRPEDELKKEMEQARKDCDSIVFTGGEVTIRKDIFGLVLHAKKLGYRTIQLQSNMRMLSYIDFCKKMIDAGVTEFSPAIHGHNAELHDHLTRSPGSFEQTIKAIKNLKSLGQKIMTNTVVVKPNYKHLPKIAELLVKLQVDQYQLAFMHAIGNGWKYYDEMMPKICDASPFIHKALQIGIDAEIQVMAEAVPYCHMKGYENHVAERYIPKTQISDVDGVNKRFEITRKETGKMKFEQCKKCIHFDICEGPWKEYPQKMGDDEFKAVVD